MSVITEIIRQELQKTIHGAAYNRLIKATIKPVKNASVAKIKVSGHRGS